MPDYSWLADKKKEAMMKKLQKRGTPSYRQLPISERYGVGYTGLGPDGKLDPNAPAGMTGNHLFHEGEMATRIPEGNMYVDARTTRMAFPETQQQQAEMKLNERSGNLPGYAAGGAFLDSLTNDNGIKKTTDAISKIGSDVADTAINTAIGPTFTIPKRTITPPDKIDFKPSQPITVQTPTIAGTQTAAERESDSIDYKIQEPVMAPPLIVPDAMNRKGVPQAKPDTIDYRAPESVAAPPLIVPQTSPSQSPPAPIDVSSIRSVQTTPAETSTVTPAEETDEDRARKAGLEYMTGSLAGTNRAQMLEAQKALSDLSARQQQERSAYEQQLIQQGVDPAQARVLSQQLRNKQESERNDLQAQYGIAGMQAREATAANLASTGLSGQQFEEQKAQYGNTEGWRAYEAAIAAGDFETAAKSYKSVTGQDISMDQMKTYQTYLNTKRQQDIASGQLSIDAQGIANEAAKLGVDASRLQAFVNAVNSGSDLATANSTSGLTLTDAQYAGMRQNYAYQQDTQSVTLSRLKNTLGDEQWTSVQTMIDQGASVDQVNDRLKKQGKAPLSDAEYMSMLDSTPLGERNWGRKMASANMLLTTPGADNKIRAASIYEDLFPGTGINFDEVIAAEDSEKFSDGLSLLASYVASGLSYQEAFGLMQAGGVADKMGVDASQLGNLYNALNVNAVDEEWQEFSTSDFYKGLTPEEQDEQEEFFRQKMLGQLDYTTLHEYEIYDPATGELKNTIYGKDSSEADKYAAKYGYTTKDTGKVKFQAASTITSSDTTIGSEKPEVDKWVAFDKDQSKIPESERITYSEWKNSEMPETYAGYLESKKGKPDSVISEYVEKYKAGWPPVKENLDPNNHGYVLTSDVITRKYINNARESFMGTPEKAIVISSKNNDGEQGREIWDALERTSSKEAASSTPIIIPGYDAPFVFVKRTTSNDGSRTYYEMASLRDGELIKIYESMNHQK